MIDGLGTGLILILPIALFAFWIWMLVECLTKEPSEGNDRIIWVLVLVFLNYFGAALYFFVRRTERINRFGE